MKTIIEKINNPVLNSYIDKLIRLNQFEIWSINIKKQDKDTEDFLRSLAKETNFYDFIVSSFDWGKTNEDLSYWSFIAHTK